MAHSLSAKKRIRQSLKRRARNRFRKDQVKDEVKVFNTLLATGKVDQAVEQLNKVTQRLDRVASKHTIHKNNAARKRSRLALKLNAVRAGTIKAVAPHGAKGKAKASREGTKGANA